MHYHLLAKINLLKILLTSYVIGRTPTACIIIVQYLLHGYEIYSMHDPLYKQTFVLPCAVCVAIGPSLPHDPTQQHSHHKEYAHHHHSTQ